LSPQSHMMVNIALVDSVNRSNHNVAQSINQYSDALGIEIFWTVLGGVLKMRDWKTGHFEWILQLPNLLPLFFRQSAIGPEIKAWFFLWPWNQIGLRSPAELIDSQTKTLEASVMFPFVYTLWIVFFIISLVKFLYRLLLYWCILLPVYAEIKIFKQHYNRAQAWFHNCTKYALISTFVPN